VRQKGQAFANNDQNQSDLQAGNHESLKDKMISGKSHKPSFLLKVLHYQRHRYYNAQTLDHC